MNLIKSSKRHAREVLAGNWFKGGFLSVAAGFIRLCCIGAEIALGEWLQLHYWEDPMHTPDNYLDDRPALLLLPLGLFVGGALLCFLLSAPLQLGKKRWFLHLAAQDHLPLSAAFSDYKIPRRLIKVLIFETRLNLRKGLAIGCCFLPIALGFPPLYYWGDRMLPQLPFLLLIFASLFLSALLATIFSMLWSARYFLAEYFYLLDAGSMKNAFRRSVTCMKGQKADVVALMFSFFPLTVADLLLLPRFWTASWRQAVTADYAMQLIQEWAQKAVADAVVAPAPQSERFPTREFPCVS